MPENIVGLSARELEMLREVGAVMVKYPDCRRMELVLHHQHFALKKGEVMLEKIDVESRTLMQRPVPADRVPKSAIPTPWIIDREGAVLPGPRHCHD